MKTLIAQWLSSPARVRETDRPTLTVGLVQTRWHADPAEHRAVLAEGIAAAATAGAEIVFLPELTLSRYPADVRPSGAPDATAEPLAEGPTFAFAAEQARANDVIVHASLFERAPQADGRGFNRLFTLGVGAGRVRRRPGACVAGSSPGF